MENLLLEGAKIQSSMMAAQPCGCASPLSLLVSSSYLVRVDAVHFLRPCCRLPRRLRHLRIYAEGKEEPPSSRLVSLTLLPRRGRGSDILGRERDSSLVPSCHPSVRPPALLFAFQQPVRQILTVGDDNVDRAGNANHSVHCAAPAPRAP